MAMSETLIDADIRKARTLPSRFYTEPLEFERLKRVFTGWQFAAHSSELETHSILPLTHIEAITGESVLLLRDKETRCLSNVCTHRGMRLALEACTKKTLQCRYHGRTFNLDGTFRHMPEFEQAIGFPSEEDNLHHFPLKQWLGMYFTSQEEVPDLPWEMLE